MPHGIYDYDGPPRVSYEGHVFYAEDIVRDHYDLDAGSEGDRLDVVVSGGSMGGLFTAHALGEGGHGVDVFEKTARGEMRGRGGGIVLHPELLQYMRRHGIADPEDIVFTIDGLEYVDREGDVFEEFDYEFFATSWDTTYRALRRALPEDCYHMDQRVEDATQNEESVTVSFEERDEVESDLLVVAEGYGSDIRRQFLPGVDLEYAGYVAWRGIASERDLPADLVDRLREGFVYYHGPDTHVLSYAVPGPEGSTERGDRRINLVWYQNVSAGEELNDLLLDTNGIQREGSLPPGTVREEVKEAHVKRARETAPTVFTRLFEAYDEPYIQAIYDLAVPEMVFDRVCVLGDAAFFIRPHMAAGTSHAAADGIALGEALSGSDDRDDLDVALGDWEEAQLDLGWRLVERARERGDRYMGQL